MRFSRAQTSKLRFQMRECLLPQQTPPKVCDVPITSNHGGTNSLPKERPAAVQGRNANMDTDPSLRKQPAFRDAITGFPSLHFEGNSVVGSQTFGCSGGAAANNPHPLLPDFLSQKNQVCGRICFL